MARAGPLLTEMQGRKSRLCSQDRPSIAEVAGHSSRSFVQLCTRGPALYVVDAAAREPFCVLP